MCHLKCQGREVRSNRKFVGDGTVVVKPDDNAKYKMIKDGMFSYDVLPFNMQEKKMFT
jgi:hypothetical protein